MASAWHGHYIHSKHFITDAQQGKLKKRIFSYKYSRTTIIRTRRDLGK